MCFTTNWPCLIRSTIQKKRMSIDFDLFAFILSVAMPIATVLSMRSRVGGWRYPRSCRILRKCTAACAIWKPPANSASATDATTQEIVLLLQLIGPLIP
jgi:hypothetical protein